MKRSDAFNSNISSLKFCGGFIKASSGLMKTFFTTTYLKIVPQNKIGITGDILMEYIILQKLEILR